MEHSATHIEFVSLGVLACAVAYALLSKAISRSVLTLPIIFVAVGYLCAPATQAFGTTEELRSSARIVAEITLILILFADASHVRLARLKADFGIPLRMLALGLPGSIALGAFVVYSVFPAGGIAMALLTAALLTPTDSALGQAVMSNPKVPERLRQATNVEGGLNDGLVLPFVLLGAILASMGASGTEGLAWLALTQLVIAPLVGTAIGWSLAHGLDFARTRDWMFESAEGVVFLGMALGSFLASEAVGGNGFIAAFVAGAVFGNTYRHDIRFISEFMDSAGQLLTMLSFLMFGALMLPDAVAHMSWSTALVALSFLSVVRMLPILVSLTGSKLAWREKLFLGWFGPRGLASILFTLIILDEFALPGEEELLACVSLTVALSVLLHGISGAPLAKWMGRRDKADAQSQSSS